MQCNDMIVYVFGDSHSVIFNGAETKFYKMRVAGYDGASISGLNEETSKLEYGKHIINIITHEPKTYYILIKLGQVDIEFVMYHKIYVNKEIFTFIEFCDSLIDKYRKFINNLLQINKNVIIASINLPSYNDDIIIKDYIERIITNADMSIDISNDIALDHNLCDFSLLQLTKNFMYFNERLSNLAKELNLKFFDTTELFIDPMTNLLKDGYRYHGHHYKGWCDDTISDAKIITQASFNSFFINHYVT
jgi:hypothetical protein